MAANQNSAGADQPADPPTPPLQGDQEVRLRDTLDTLTKGLQVIGLDWRYLYLNATAAAHGRSSARELVGRTMMECYPGIETTPLFQVLERCMSGRGSEQVDNEFTYPDGTTAWFRLWIEPVAEGLSILSINITERKQAELALQRSEARHRSLLKALPEVVFVLDRSGRYLDYHAPPTSPFAIPREAVVNRTLRDVLPAEAAGTVAAAAERALETQGTVTAYYDLMAGEERRRFEAIVSPAEEGRVTVVARDVTDRLVLEDQLRQAQKMEAVGQLTGGIAHDFNNVLTVIGSNADLLAEAIPADAPGRQELEELSSAVSRGAEMISRLLRFSRRAMLHRQPVNPAEVLGGLTPILRRLLPESIRVRVTGSDAPGTVLLDAGALEQIVVNLCTNARDAMPEGGELRIDCQATWLDAGYHATHPWVVPGPYVCIAVADTGTGMDDRTLRKVFEPFFTTKPAGLGTGLGMAMVYGLMKEHEGMVHIYSEPGRGSVVKLYFPLADEPTSQAVRRSSDPGLVRGGKETLLLVEDEAAIRRASRRALQGKGYTVLEAADGEEALDIFRQHAGQIALIISDLVMPRLGGRQLAEALRADGATVPILFTSGYASGEDYREHAWPSAVEFLQKPWRLSELFHIVRQILDGGGKG